MCDSRQPADGAGSAPIETSDEGVERLRKADADGLLERRSPLDGAGGPYFLQILSGTMPEIEEA